MSLSQTGSYTNQICRNQISMPTSQMWSYTRTHISMQRPIQDLTRKHISESYGNGAFGSRNSIESNS
ncbi:Membrane insertase YidC [Gossypium arboreum]|uniref:Membrane insertase YidC n=1 Tax=Gossypium arboreum TaxID=29729 RepID=A0A0B0ME21_GOSAR|nr:Membrane insertase YidC [Gossypium arboreum]